MVCCIAGFCLMFGVGLVAVFWLCCFMGFVVCFVFGWFAFRLLLVLACDILWVGCFNFVLILCCGLCLLCFDGSLIVVVILCLLWCVFAILW